MGSFRFEKLIGDFDDDPVTVVAPRRALTFDATSITKAAQRVRTWAVRNLHTCQRPAWDDDSGLRRLQRSTSGRRVREGRSFLPVLFLAPMRQGFVLRSEGGFDEDPGGLRDFL